MSRYQRWIDNDSERLKRLMDSPLFTKHILPDIRKGEVFPAIRKGKIDFYHVGRKLFSFDGKEFRSNVAYLVSFQDKPNGEVGERAFKKLQLCSSFEDGYTQIKHNTTLYSEPESKAVSDLWKNNSCCLEPLPRFSVFDIELSLTASESKRSQDRIDLILFDSESKELRCFEVKTFDNKEIRRKNGRIPVVEQIARYTKQVKNRNADLVADYRQYVSILNRLCGVSIPQPKTLSEQVDLVVFDFTTPQKRLLTEKIIPSFEGQFDCKAKGDAKGANQKTINKWWK